MVNKKSKINYRPLVDLLNEETPTVVGICDVLRRAARKNVDLKYSQFKEEYHNLFKKANLSKGDFKKLKETLNSCVDSLEARGRSEKRGYIDLSVYVFDESI